MPPSIVEQALRHLVPLARRPDLQPSIGAPLEGAIRALESLPPEGIDAASDDLLRAAIAELWRCLASLEQSRQAHARQAQADARPARDREVLDQVSAALALLLPLELHQSASGTGRRVPAAPPPAAPPPIATVPPQAPAPAPRLPVFTPRAVSAREPAAPPPAAPEPAPPAAPEPAPPPPAATAAETDPPFLPDVVEQHLDDAEFLVTRWLAAARSSRFSARLLHKTIEPRLIAHLDGLVVNGRAAAEELVWPMLLEEGSGPESKRTAAALAVLADRAPAPAQRLLAVLRDTAEEKTRRGVQRAYQIAARPELTEALRLALYATDSAPAQGALLAILSSSRHDPGPIVGALLTSPDVDVLAGALDVAAATAAGARAQHGPAIAACLDHALPAVRAAALRTGLIWNLEPARQACLAQARAGVAAALVHWALIGDQDAVPLLGAALALALPEARIDALWALGFTGSPDAVAACLPLLDDPEQPVARQAAESIAWITGLPLRDAPFALPPTPRKQQDELPPLARDLEEDLMPRPTDDLPNPDPARIRDWWAERAAAFDRGRRYLRGQPLSLASVQAALLEGPLRRSGPLACEIAIRTSGEIQLEALRLRHPEPVLPPALEGSLHRAPRWH